MWMLQVPVFTETYKVITPDSRGLGISDKIPKVRDFSLKRLSDDVSDLMDHLGIEKAFIVGNSLGGAVAEKFCLDHIERVQASVWIGAPTFPLGELLMDYDGRKNVPFVDVYTNALNDGYMNFWQKVWKPLMSYNYHESFVKTFLGNYLVRYLFEERYARLNSDPRNVIAVLSGLDDVKSSLDEDLAKLTVPCAILCGDGDDTRPSCERQHRAIPKAEFLVFKDSGHFCYMDQVETFNGFLRRFLERHSP